MGADQQEQNLIPLLLENCPIITGHIDTSTAGKFLPDRVVVEKGAKTVLERTAAGVQRACAAQQAEALRDVF